MSENDGITTLQSAKYLPEEVIAELNAAAAKDQPATPRPEPTDQTTESPSIFTPPRNTKAPWTTGLSVVCGLWLLIGTIGALSCMADLSRELLPNKVKAQAVAKSPLVAKVVGATDKHKPLLLFQSLFKGGLGVAMLLSVGFLLLRRPNAHGFAMTVCVCAIFYQFSGLVVSQLVLRSVAQVVESTPGGLATVMAAQARAEGKPITERQKRAIREMSLRIGGSMQIAVLMMAIAVLLFKSLFYGLTMMFLNTSPVREVFAPDEGPPQVAVV